MSTGDWVLVAFVLSALVGCLIGCFAEDVKYSYWKWRKNRYKYKGFIYLGCKQDPSEKWIYQFENKKKEPFNLYGAPHYRHSLTAFSKYDINCYNDKYLTGVRSSER